MRLIILSILLTGLIGSPAGAGSLHQQALDAEQDQLMQRVVVPSVEKPQGEVQVLRRGDLLVVQTLLASRILKRVVAVIDQKEQRRWPESREGHVDSKRYREELFRAMTEVWQRFRQRADKTEKRQYLAIEFILGPERSLIALSAPQVTGEYGQLQLTGKETLAAWRSSEQYVSNNIKEIIQDSFDLDAAAAEKLLAADGPIRP
ncbi:MAG: hypothetical protein C0623_09270 [Desulfuromonas sp.]|nr:MAG: hypothetical protein C0623_09270 [Desulfuromonas sp.]